MSILNRVKELIIIKAIRELKLRKPVGEEEMSRAVNKRANLL